MKLKKGIDNIDRSLPKFIKCANFLLKEPK